MNIFRKPCAVNPYVEDDFASSSVSSSIPLVTLQGLF